MNNTKNLIGGMTGTAVSFLGMTIENADHFVSIICGISGLIITIITCLVIPLIRKIREAKKDGKIDDREMDEIIDTLKKGSDKVKEKIDEINEKDKK